MKDKYHRPHGPELMNEAKAGVVTLPSQGSWPGAELWAISALARFVSDSVQAAGFARLAKAGRVPSGASSTSTRSDPQDSLLPGKARPRFDRKLQEALMVYWDVSIYREGAVHDARRNPIYSVSVDEG